MMLVPMGMAMGADVTASEFLLKNLLPVTLGNIVAGVPTNTQFCTALAAHTC